MNPTSKKMVGGVIALLAIVSLAQTQAIIKIAKAGNQNQQAAVVTAKTSTKITDNNRDTGSVPSPLLCTALSHPKIRVNSPNGGEVYTSGQPINITWSSCNIPANTLLEINVNGSGIAMGFLAPNGTPNDGVQIITQNWPVGTYRITIGTPLFAGAFNNSALAISDQSDNVFNIVATDQSLTQECNARVLYPHPNETFTLAENATPSGNLIDLHGFVLVNSDDAGCVWGTAGNFVPTTDPNGGAGGLISVVEPGVGGSQTTGMLKITGNYNFADPTIGDRLYSQHIIFDPQTYPAGLYHLQFTDMDNQHPIIIPINIEY